MKKILSILCTTALAILLCTGCVSTKKITYFQGSEELFQQPRQITQQYEMRLKPADQVVIKVSSRNPELLEVFSTGTVMGSSSQNSASMTSANGTLGNVYGFTVTNSGELILPAIGSVKVEGYTTEEAADVIEERIKALGLVKDPDITVRLLNARVTVVGAVHTPKVVNLTSERNTIVDVLSQCGDIDDTGLRYKIKLYREEKGQMAMYELDMTKSDIFTSPAYYVQQNDMIYVEHNKSKKVKTSAFYTALGAWSSIVGALSTIASLSILIYNVTTK